MLINITEENSLKKAAKILLSGGILIFPTDTVYGIGCLLDAKAIKKLYKIKNRPLTQPTAILLTKKLYHFYCSSIKSGIEIIMPANIKNNFLNGRMTLVIDKKYLKTDIPKILIGNNKVGIRIPKYKWLEKLINNVGPIAASSANKKRERAPKSFDEINAEIIKEVDLVVRTNECMSGKPSAVYDLELKKYIRD